MNGITPASGKYLETKQNTPFWLGPKGLPLKLAVWNVSEKQGMLHVSGMLTEIQSIEQKQKDAWHSWQSHETQDALLYHKLYIREQIDQR